jgi:hypothetical protein
MMRGTGRSMKYALIALISCAVAPALAQEVKALNPADLAVQTHRWEGDVVKTTLNCFYADQDEYRCYDADSLDRVRVDFRSFDPSGKAFLQSHCDRIGIANTSQCRVTLVFTYESFEVLPVGGLNGDITLVRPKNFLGFILRHSGMSAPSVAELRNAERFLEGGSLDIPASSEAGSNPSIEQAPGNPASSIPHRGGNRDCTGVPPAEWTLDCVFPQGQRSLAISSKSNEAPECSSAQPAAGVGKCDPSASHGAQASNRSCDAYSKIEGALLEATNHELQLEMKYHIEENGHIRAELVLNTSSSAGP